MCLVFLPPCPEIHPNAAALLSLPYNLAIWSDKATTLNKDRVVLTSDSLRLIVRSHSTEFLYIHYDQTQNTHTDRHSHGLRSGLDLTHKNSVEEGNKSHMKTQPRASFQSHCAELETHKHREGISPLFGI